LSTLKIQLVGNCIKLRDKRGQKQRKKQITKDNTAKQNNKNYPDSVTSYNTWSGNEVGLFHQSQIPRAAHSVYKVKVRHERIVLNKATNDDDSD